MSTGNHTQYMVSFWKYRWGYGMQDVLVRRTALLKQAKNHSGPFRENYHKNGKFNPIQHIDVNYFFET
jgi:hypothetical protein